MLLSSNLFQNSFDQNENHIEKNPPTDGKFQLHFILSLQFIQSSLFCFPESTWENKEFFLERFINPNAEQLWILHVSTYKYSANLI